MAHLTQANTDRSLETFLLGPYVHETPFTILGRPEAVALLNSLGSRMAASAAARAATWSGILKTSCNRHYNQQRQRTIP